MMNSFKVVLVAGIVSSAWWTYNVNRSADKDITKPLIVVSSSTQSVNSVDNNSIDPFAVVDDPVAIRVSDTKPVVEFSSGECNLNCLQAIEHIRFESPLPDTQYESALAYTDDLAAHLRARPELRYELIQVAVQTTGGKRSLIINSFMQLEHEDQLMLGTALLDSEFSNHRHDGVNLLASTENMNKSVALRFSELLVVEQDTHIRESMVKALDRSELFASDREILEVLSHVRATDTDPSVRGTALLASARLTTGSEDILTSAIAAIRSNTPEYQAFGVRTLEEILFQQGADYGLQGNLAGQQLAGELMTQSFDDLPDDLRDTLDNLSDRFFSAY